MGTTNNDVLLINSSTLTDIADAIRAKHNVNTKYYPSEMAVQISNIETSPNPITVNITQSANQTIKVSSSSISSWTNRTTSGSFNAPSGIRLTATITPNSGYNAGTLNQSNVTANWGDTVSFSATPATARVGVLNVTMSTTANRPNRGDHISVTYTFTAIGGSTSSQTFENEATNSGFTIQALSENQTATYNDTFTIAETDILAGYLNCNTLTSTGQFTTSGSFNVTTAAANPSLTVQVGNIDFDDPLVEDSEITFDVIVTNNGNLTLTNISISSTVADENWIKDSLAPGVSQTYSTNVYVTSSHVEDGYITLDASATADNPIPNGAQINVTDSEDINTSAPVTWAAIYLLPSTDGFTVSTNMTNTATQSFETVAGSLGFGANPENADLCTIYTGANFVRTIAPQTELVLNDELNTYNEDDYLVDTSNNTLPLYVAWVIDAVNLQPIPFASLGLTSITNYAINLTGLRAAIDTNQIDVTNGIFIVLTDGFD